MYASKNVHKHQKHSQLSARAFQDRKGNGCFKNIQNQHTERSQLSARAFQDRKGNVAMLQKTNHQKHSQLSTRALQDRKVYACFKKCSKPPKTFTILYKSISRQKSVCMLQKTFKTTKNIHNSLQEHFKSEKGMHAYKNVQNQHTERS